MHARLAAAFAAAAVLAAPALAQAQAQPAADTPFPGVAGYSHPDIGADACKKVDASRVQCTIPAKTAGRYLVEASGTSTAKGEGAAQQLVIGGNGWQCGPAVNKAPWTKGSRTFKLDCVVDVLTDGPVPIIAVYADQNADKDAAGPTLSVRRVGWNGILDARPVGAK
jgi:hypothetical protein